MKNDNYLLFTACSNVNIPPNNNNNKLVIT